MDNSTWTSNPPTAQQVGPIPMAFEWSRDQSMPSESIPRPVGLQGPPFQTAPHHHNGNGNGNGNGLIHGQPSPAVTPGLSTPMGLNDGSLGGNGLHGADPSAFNPNQLHQHQQQHQQQRHPSDMPPRAGNSSSPREEFHHHHMHPSQQQQQLHQNHSPYSQGHMHGHEFASQEQLQQQQQQQQQQHQPQQQPFQHSVYPAVHYYPEAAQHEQYEHSRAHSGGLVGQPYGHSQDNLASLTPPPSAVAHDLPPLRARLTNTIWEDERTFCYQVDVKGVCVARRADNNMVNGTKLLNVVGMSRGKRDGILKNEKGRIVVKVGAMHLKGVWIPLDRAVHHAKAHNIEESLHPLLVDDPTPFLYQHPHGPVMTSDPRWAPQSQLQQQQQQQQQQHDAYHDPEDSPNPRHSDSHGGHHFNQGIHGEYYPHSHHGAFRGHGGISPHGSPNGSNGSISGDDDPNLVSPFDYRVQSSVGAGGLIGVPSGGPGLPDLRSGGHHPSYYSHQTSPHQYYNTHASQKYQEPMLQHPGQHQLQLGGPLASDSPPLQTSSAHDGGTLHRLQGGSFAGKKRQLDYRYPSQPQKGGHGLSASVMVTGDNSSPSLSLVSSESHSSMTQPSDANSSLNPPAKRPRSAARVRAGSLDPSTPQPGQWYSGREDDVEKSTADQIITSASHLPPSVTTTNSSVNDSSSSTGGGYYETASFVHQPLPPPPQQQHQHYSAHSGPRDSEAGRPRFMSGPRSRLSSFQDVFEADGLMPQSGGATPTPFGRAQPSPHDEYNYGRPAGAPGGDSSAPFIKIEGVVGGFGQSGWS